MHNTSFLQTQTIRHALEFTLENGGFARNGMQRKEAKLLLRRMSSTESVSGRHDSLRRLLKKGATMEEMIKITGSSRRTIFRYLNHFEEAGLDIRIIDGKYHLK